MKKFNYIGLVGIVMIIFIVIVFYTYSHQSVPRVTLFPIEHYDQSISNWTKTAGSNELLMSKKRQQGLFHEFLRHYFVIDALSMSPWNSVYVSYLLTSAGSKNLYSNEEVQINQFDNRNVSTTQPMRFGMNFRPFSQNWIEEIRKKINLAQFLAPFIYDEKKRAIATENTSARILPTEEAAFFDPTLAGEGYPFDYLQGSAVWAGTPLYILGKTTDQAWSLVLTPDTVVWVKSNAIATVDKSFIQTWETASKKSLINISHVNVPFIDKMIYRFSGYPGTILPLKAENKTQFEVLIPVRDIRGKAEIHDATVSKEDAVRMPLELTPKNFSAMMNNLLGRIYGWGNLNFYNDCSAESKGIYSLFGIWIPRNSSWQVNPNRFPGTMVDASHFNPDERLAYLKEHGHAWMTLIYTGGHVLMYLGSYVNPKDSLAQPVALSYQNLWGLRPRNATPETDTREVVGGSVLFPLLKFYPENKKLGSSVYKKYFKLMYLDEGPDLSSFQKIEFDNATLASIMLPST